MRPDLAAKYDLRVPRYTSYPTAPHFHPGVTGETYRTWLGGIDPTLELSLYLHVAFCAEMCWFCGCHTKITKRYAPVATYMNAVWREIEMVADSLPARMAARHIHFGGGSPTILTPEDFVKTVDLLKSRFLLKDGAEIAVELDPRTADETYIKALSSAGVTRASIGVQDLETTVQKAINRIQPYEVSERVVNWLRQYGVPEVNVDLVYGLPHQTLDGLLATIDKSITSFRPRRVALFGYAHVPWMKKHQRLIPEDALPDTDTRWQMYLEGCKMLTETHGYVQIGLDHFAAPDDAMAVALKTKTLNRNFQGYTTDTASTLIGFGASGIGSLPQGYVVNEGEVHAYERGIGEGRFPITRGIAVTDEDRLRRDIIERLMCDLEIDLDIVAGRHGRSGADFEGELASLSPLEADGLVTVEGHRIVVTEEGRTLVRAVCAAFDRYLKAGEQRHSKAV
jgi:oxygen-independent coproporphyrinogen-3 oxidase